MASPYLRSAAKRVALLPPIDNDACPLFPFHPQADEMVPWDTKGCLLALVGAGVFWAVAATLLWIFAP